MSQHDDSVRGPAVSYRIEGVLWAKIRTWLCSRRRACGSGPGGQPRLSFCMSSGPKVIPECHRTAESTRMDIQRLQTWKAGSAQTSQHRAGCWQSNGRPIVT